MIAKKKWIIALLVLTTFLLMRYIKYFWAYAIIGVEEWNAMDTDVAVTIVVYSQLLVVFLVTLLLFQKQALGVLGLQSGLIKGLMIGFLTTLPMFIGYGIVYGLHEPVTLSLVHHDLVLAGFFEELLFRGFLFGILYYRAGWGFVPAIIIPSVFFGIGHLYQAHSFSESMAVFAFTTLASCGFAFFYVVWRNLWVVIFLHGFMDLAWSLAAIDANVMGNFWGNVFRFMTLGVMIAISIRYLIKHPENGLRGRWWKNLE